MAKPSLDSIFGETEGKKSLESIFGDKPSKPKASFRTEVLAPVAHAASLFAADIPKVAAKKDQSEAGKETYDIMYPEQQTVGGKALRLGLSVPAVVAGTGAKLAIGAGKLATKAASKVGSKIAANKAAQIAGKAGKTAIEGAAFGAGYAAESKDEYLENVGKGALMNVAGAGAGKILKSIPKVSKFMSARIITSMIKPTKGQYSYGKSPASVGLTVAKKVGSANNLDDLFQKTSKVTDETGRKIGSIIDANAGNKLNISSSIKPLELAMNKAASQNNEALLKRLSEVKNAIVHRLVRGKSPEGKDVIQITGIRNLKNMSPREAFEMKKTIAALTKWTGNPSDDKLVNSALQNTYRAIKSKLNESIPELKTLNEDYANLLTAKIATKDAITREANKQLIGLADTAIGATGTILGVTGGGLETFLAGLGTIGLKKALESPFARTRMAKWLNKLSDVEKARIIKKFPDLSRVPVGLAVKGDE